MGAPSAVIANVGQELLGDSTNYLKGDSDLLQSSITGKSALVVVRAKPTSIDPAKKNYILKANPVILLSQLYSSLTFSLSTATDQAETI